MSTIISKKRIFFPTHVRNYPYLRTKNQTYYEPLLDQKGIHCEGDQFGYVVDWEIVEEIVEDEQNGRSN